MRAKNLTLLGKWRYRFLVEHEAPWRNIMKNLCGDDGDFWERTNSGLKKGVWEGIISSSIAIDKLDVPFGKSFMRKIDDGSQTSFWLGTWFAPDIILKDHYPCLYALDEYKSAIVSDRCVSNNGKTAGCWNWRSNPRCRDVDDLKSLTSVIKGFEISGNSPNRWVWFFDP